MQTGMVAQLNQALLGDQGSADLAGTHAVAGDPATPAQEQTPPMFGDTLAATARTAAHEQLQFLLC